MFRHTVHSYEKGLLFHNGRFVKVIEPGRYWTLFGHSILNVDVRMSQIICPGQEILTRDQLSPRLSLIVRYRIARPEVAYLEVKNVEALLYAAAQLRLREAVANRTFDQVRLESAAMGAEVMESLQPDLASLGLSLDSTRILDVTPPAALKKAYAQVEVARQEGLASLERARGESAALRNLANAARMLEGRPELLALRTLQSIEQGSGNIVLLNRLLGQAQSRTAMPIETPEE